MVVTYVIAGLLAVGALVAWWQARLLHGKAIAMGTVTELPASTDSDGDTTRGIVAEFRDPSGGIHTYRSTWKSSHPGYAVGDPIPIYYDAEAPDTANGIASFSARFGIAFSIAYLGVVLMAMTVAWPWATFLFNSVFHP